MADSTNSCGPPSGARNSEGIPKLERMRSSAEIRRVLDQGDTFVGRFMVLKVLFLPDDRVARRFAVIASKKVGGSVERSRAKRRLRELYRLHRNRLRESGLRLVMISRYRLVKAPQPMVEKEFRYLLGKAGIWKEPRP